MASPDFFKKCIDAILAQIVRDNPAAAESQRQSEEYGDDEVQTLKLIAITLGCQVEGRMAANAAKVAQGADMTEEQERHLPVWATGTANGVHSAMEVRTMSPTDQPTPEQVESACVAFRDDYGTLPLIDQLRMQYAARSWLTVWQEEFAKPSVPPEPSDDTLIKAAR